MKKEVLAFDLDSTLAVSKTAITPAMAAMLQKLLGKYKILVISGGKWELFQEQIIEQMAAAEKLFQHLHLMPTCGTAYYSHDGKNWQRIYYEALTADEAAEIFQALEASAKALGYWERQVWGEIIENRGTQVTFSALGQAAPPEEKYKWDPNHSKKNRLRDHVQKNLPNFDIKVGGTTSIDVTKPGIDKAYGVKRFIKMHGYNKEQLLFFGDMLHEGGNDYPVKAMGVESIAVKSPEHTLELLEKYLK